MENKNLKLEAASIACDEHKPKLFPIGTRVKLRNEPLATEYAIIAVPPHHKTKHCEDCELYCLALPTSSDSSYLIYRPYSEVVAL